jgi:tRNA(adenine34) deaminase
MTINNRMKIRPSAWLAKAMTLLLLFLSLAGIGNAAPMGSAAAPMRPHELDAIEKEINSYVPDSRYPDDPFILATVKEGLEGARERNGGIGACLVRKATGEVIDRTHNRQHEPYFRSDLHAEMDLLNRYEDRVKLTRSRDPRDPSFRNPRNMKGIVLYTSLEPCPMCLTRIINTGLQEVYYAAIDQDGGMARRFENLPPSWKRMATGVIIRQARCSPKLIEISGRLFRPMYATGLHKH